MSKIQSLGVDFEISGFFKSIWKSLFILAMCDFKMDLIKWQLNFVSCNFSLKSYLWFQIELALRARSILKSRVWFQTKLHSTQFNYDYKHGLHWLLFNNLYIYLATRLFFPFLCLFGLSCTSVFRSLLAFWSLTTKIIAKIIKVN